MYINGVLGCYWCGKHENLENSGALFIGAYDAGGGVPDVSSARIDLDKGDPLQYIYNTGYLYKTGQTTWTPVSYTSPEPSSPMPGMPNQQQRTSP
jgi:hypothetical protein